MLGMPVRKIRPEDEVEIVSMIQEKGLRIEEIAEIFGVSRPTVYSFLKERGYEQRWIKQKGGAGTTTATAPTTSTLGEIAPTVTVPSVSETEPGSGDAVGVGNRSNG